MTADKSDADDREKRSPSTAFSGTMGLQESFLSPGFRSAAAMAGWDEEALLVASFIVEDTPARESRHGKRPAQRPFRTPPVSTNSRRRRRSRRQSPESVIQPVVLCLDEDSDQAIKTDTAAARNEPAPDVAVGAAEDKKVEASLTEKGQGEAFACMERLREELSCAICLEICFEPSTTPCGHSFCINCLKCAAAKCGKRCPKCRQLISNGRSCTVNTVLWNTIQLLFPKEVEARKDAVTAVSHSSETPHETPMEASNRNSSVRTNSRNSIRVAARASQNLERDQTFRRRTGPSQSEDAAVSHSSETPHETPMEASNRNSSVRTNSRNSIRVAARVSQNLERDQTFRRRTGPSQSEDAALAFRLQREEFIASFHGMSSEQQRNALHAARANLRAIRSRALHIRNRNRAS